MHFAFKSDGSLFEGAGHVSRLEVYELQRQGEGWVYRLKSSDESPESLAYAEREIRDGILTSMINNFYEYPNYEIYSMKPTGEHVQVYVEVGHRRGQVDAGIATLIGEVWRIGLDTIGSCQCRPAGHKYPGMAYLGFPRPEDAEFLQKRCEEASIYCVVEPKKLKLGHQPKQAGESETIEFDSANVLFMPDDIDRITEALRSVEPVRP